MKTKFKVGDQLSEKKCCCRYIVTEITQHSYVVQQVSGQHKFLWNIKDCEEHCNKEVVQVS